MDWQSGHNSFVAGNGMYVVQIGNWTLCLHPHGSKLWQCHRNGSLEFHLLLQFQQCLSIPENILYVGKHRRPCSGAKGLWDINEGWKVPATEVQPLLAVGLGETYCGGLWSWTILAPSWGCSCLAGLSPTLRGCAWGWQWSMERLSARSRTWTMGVTPLPCSKMQLCILAWSCHVRSSFSAYLGREKKVWWKISVGLSLWV